MIQASYEQELSELVEIESKAPEISMRVRLLYGASLI